MDGDRDLTGGTAVGETSPSLWMPLSAHGPVKAVYCSVSAAHVGDLHEAPGFCLTQSWPLGSLRC